MIEDQNMSLLVFTLAAFIAPKQVMRSFEVTKQTVFESAYIHRISDFHKKQAKRLPFLARSIQFLQDSKAQKEIKPVILVNSKMKKQTVQMNDFLTQDFFGYLKNRSLDYKKMKTLEIYRLIVRFSIEKVRLVSDTEVFQIIILQYIKSSRLSRIHQKDVLKKYESNYYRAIENIVNCS